MTITTSLKFAGLTIAAIGLTAGVAFAGEGCKDKAHKTTAMKSEAATQNTAVLAASTEKTKYSKAKTAKVLTFEEALKLCQSAGVSDLQACVDKKTGVMPKS